MFKGLYAFISTFVLLSFIIYIGGVIIYTFVNWHLPSFNLAEWDKDQRAGTALILFIITMISSLAASGASGSKEE